MDSDVQRRIRRLFGAIVFAFLILLGWQSYWHLFQSDWLLARPMNRRLSRVEQRVPRGVIYDRNGTRLAWSEQGVRRYADARATAGVLGYMDPVYGRTGVEGEWNLELSGFSRTFTPQELQRILSHRKPHGNDLTLTLDLSLQQAATAVLQEYRGAIAVLDPASGGILALATSPSFDPTTIRENFAAITARGDGALRNRAAQDRYPPGSSMKVVTAAAALMHGVDPGTRYTCQGKTRAYGVNITDYHGTVHGAIGMETALVKSCNNYFARTAAELPQQALVTTAENFGFGRRWWTQLPDPRMLPLAIVESSLAPHTDRSLPQGERAHMGFGQSTVVATPLQMAMVSAAIANGGVLMAPYLVSEMRGGNASPATTFTSLPIGYPVNGETAQRIADMMRGVVTRGTGAGANVRGLTVYGKTGTAQQEGGADHAWFIGFAEHEGSSKRLAFAVLIERGGTGGKIAVPVARKLLEKWLRLLR